MKILMMNFEVSTMLTILLLWVGCIAASGTTHIQPEVRECGCANSLLCLPLGEAALLHPEEPHVMTFLHKQTKPELFAFVLQCERAEWEKYDWEALTTVSVSGFEDQQLLCHAHSYGVRVVPLAGADYPADQLTNTTARAEFVASQTQYILMHGMDGINIDFEQPLTAGSPEVDAYTALVRETTESVHAAINGSQVSVDLAVYTEHDWRNYDTAGVAEASDFIFMMCYDLNAMDCGSQLCLAGANSPFLYDQQGVQKFKSLGIPGDKLVLGLPWYGYRYICEEYEDGRWCNFRQKGTQHVFSEITEMMLEAGVAPLWDSQTKSPYVSIQAEDGSWTQIWYDDPFSLWYKTKMAAAEGMRGTGIWTANFIDYGDSFNAQRLRALMWGAMVATGGQE